MKVESDYTLTERVLWVFAFDGTDDLWWRAAPEDDGTLAFYILCSDVFAWGCADMERVTPENIALLEQTKRDVGGLDDRGMLFPWVGMLFCARVRKTRPQGAMYDTIPEELWSLFDAVGPKREVGFSNPLEHPHDRKHGGIPSPQEGSE